MASRRTTGAATLESRVEILEGQMAEVLAKPAFRRSTEKGVCVLGNDPSSGCKDASLGRFQGGCRGDACSEKQREYYRNYRARTKADTNGTPVPPPRVKGVKRTAKKAAAPPAPVKKRGVKRRGG